MGKEIKDLFSKVCYESSEVSYESSAYTLKGSENLIVKDRAADSKNVAVVALSFLDIKQPTRSSKI